MYKLMLFNNCEQIITSLSLLVGSTVNVYFLQVVDMRWGVRDEATDDHMTTTLCMQEIDNCQRLSIGPNFVVSRFFLSLMRLLLERAFYFNMKTCLKRPLKQNTKIGFQCRLSLNAGQKYYRMGAFCNTFDLH